MRSEEAKQILLLYRPGSADDQDPQVARALDLAREDPELSCWFHQHCAFQERVRAKLRQIKVPKHLKQALLARRKVVRRRD